MVPFIPTKNSALVGVFWSGCGLFVWLGFFGLVVGFFVWLGVFVWLGFFYLVVGFFWVFWGGREGKASLALTGAAAEGPEHFHSLHGDSPWTLDTCGRRTGHVWGKTRGRRSRNVPSQRSGRASLQQGLLEAAP